MVLNLSNNPWTILCVSCNEEALTPNGIPHKFSTHVHFRHSLVWIWCNYHWIRSDDVGRCLFVAAAHKLPRWPPSQDWSQVPTPLPFPAPQVLLWSLRSSHFDPPHPPTSILQTPKWPSSALQNIWSPILLWNKWRWWDGVGWYKSYSRRCCLRLNAASSSDATAMASATPVTGMSWLGEWLMGGRGNDLS